MDRKLLMTIIEKFDGGPVGLGTLCASLHEEKDSIEEIIEPYLLQIGFLKQDSRAAEWRLASPMNISADALVRHSDSPTLFP